MVLFLSYVKKIVIALVIWPTGIVFISEYSIVLCKVHTVLTQYDFIHEFNAGITDQCNHTICVGYCKDILQNG